jgi:hypothetical protein
MATFGKTTAGVPGVFLTAREFAMPFALSAAGTATAINLKVAGDNPGGSGNQQVICCIYADSSGSPGALLATSAAFTVTPGLAAAYQAMTISGGVHLAAGTYWLGFYQQSAANPVIRVYYDNVTNASKSIIGPTFPALNNPFGSSGIVNETYEFCINATYTPDATPIVLNMTTGIPSQVAVGTGSSIVLQAVGVGAPSSQAQIGVGTNVVLTPPPPGPPADVPPPPIPPPPAGGVPLPFPVQDNVSFGDAVYKLLAPIAYADPINNYNLLTFVRGLGEMFQELDELAHVDTTINDSPWSSLLDINRSKDEYLSWLGQFVGVEIDLGLSLDDQRQQLRSHEGWNRGTVAALKKSIQKYLTDGQVVVVIERYPDAYSLVVSTYASETPPSQIYQDLYNTYTTYGNFFGSWGSYWIFWMSIIPNLIEYVLQQTKPAGLVLSYQILPGTPGTYSAYSVIFVEFASYRELWNAEQTYQDVYIQF